MKSDVIAISNNGKGFEDAVEQSKKVAEYEGLEDMHSLQLQMLTEEMLSLARSLTGETHAAFWIELEHGIAHLHMTTQTVLDKNKRAELIATASSRKNEAAKSFLGLIRDRFEEAMAAEPDYESLSNDLLVDIPAGGVMSEGDWDGYERSILRKLADDIKIGIRGGTVEITVSKYFYIQK